MALSLARNAAITAGIATSLNLLNSGIQTVNQLSSSYNNINRFATTAGDAYRYLTNTQIRPVSSARMSPRSFSRVRSRRAPRRRMRRTRRSRRSRRTKRPRFTNQLKRKIRRARNAFSANFAKCKRVRNSIYISDEIYGGVINQSETEQIVRYFNYGVDEFPRVNRRLLGAGVPVSTDEEYFTEYRPVAMLVKIRPLNSVGLSNESSYVTKPGQEPFLAFLNLRHHHRDKMGLATGNTPAAIENPSYNWVDLKQSTNVKLMPILSRRGRQFPLAPFVEEQVTIVTEDTSFNTTTYTKPQINPGWMEYAHSSNETTYSFGIQAPQANSSAVKQKWDIWVKVIYQLRTNKSDISEI